MNQLDWPASWAWTVGREVARLRNEQGISAETLGKMCADLGFPIPRNTIMNLEHGRKGSLPVHELVVLSAALGVPALELLFPPGTVRHTYLPEEPPADRYAAAARFTGTSSGSGPTPGQMLDEWLPREDAAALFDVVKGSYMRGKRDGNRG